MQKGIAPHQVVPKSRSWVWGNREYGYAVRRAVKGDMYAVAKPWVAEAWNRKMVSNTYFATRVGAVAFGKRHKRAPLTQKTGYGKDYWKAREHVGPGKGKGKHIY